MVINAGRFKVKDYPVSNVQGQVLAALGLTATGFSDANRKLEQLGLVVNHKRAGRTTVPVVTVKDRNAGGFYAEGDGFSFRKYPDLDVSKIAQWIAE